MTPETHPGGGGIPTYRPRDYQLEMLEASMKSNVIVAMETGSGKTHVAVLRIAAELERCHPEKLIWFMAPTVALCIQQQQVISSHILSVGTRLLIGSDNVDRWSEKSIWDAALKNIRVVVSTPDVLADALSHGFVRISQFALIIFDEAHHCRRRHPANKIMDGFYHPTRAKHGPDAVPHILGLTASPIMRSNPQELQTVESNLNSICKTPRTHRQELLTHTHRPVLRQIWFNPLSIWGTDSLSQTLTALFDSWRRIDIEADPYVKRLRTEPDNNEILRDILLTRKTYCNDQLKKLIERSCHILEELGEWAADYFIHASIQQLKALVSDDDCMLADWSVDERAYMVDFLSKIPTRDFTDTENIPISSKMESLIAFLKHADTPDFSGLVFVKQRATVGAMAKLLSVHPETKHRFRCAPYVGWSNNPKRKGLVGELHSVQSQRDTLAEFRDGRKNLIIATDVLEEGIDVSACSLVVCYDKPQNLKSFIQRRGRARQKESTYAIMFAANDESYDLDKWNALERAMIEAYQNEERQLRELYALETVDEDVGGALIVEATGARLTSEEAVKHLYHFCSVLPKQPYGDSNSRPVFSFEQDEYNLLRGIVTLPSCVDPAVRCTQGRGWWRTERAAMKDAAFQAYKSLYELGLLNDNLLPLTKKQELRFGDSANLPAVVEVQEQWDPWVDLARAWSSSPDLHQTIITVAVNRAVNPKLSMVLTGPMTLPVLEPIDLFWDSECTYTLSFNTALPVSGMTLESLIDMRNITSLYIQAPHSRRSQRETDFVALFSPHIPPDQLGVWLSKNEGTYSVSEVYSSGCQPSSMGLVRDSAYYNAPHIFQKWNASQQDHMPPVLELECRSLPRRRNLLQRHTLEKNRHHFRDSEDCGDSVSRSKTRMLSAETSTVDKLPVIKAMFGLFIPAIMNKLEISLLATQLRDTILKNVGFQSNRHIITAISAPSAQGLTNYQRYEFFGDSVLKFVVSYQIFFEKPRWHEGYLTESREAIVQNPRLAQAAIKTGLDAFIITKMLTPRKWSAPLISEKTNHNPGTRTLSRKVLADVVEALIGAAYMEGGQKMARACIHTFLPEIGMESPDFASLPRPSNRNAVHASEELKQLVGYTIHDESLLIEALTHPSQDYDVQTQSYQRLEFLGDAVLDMVVVSAIAQHSTMHVSPGDMTKLKQALVNAQLLAFLCMEFGFIRETNIITVPQTSQNPSPPEIIQETATEKVALWHFMRCRSQQLLKSREAAITRYSELREEIQSSLHNSAIYPWEALARLHPDKFFSDLIESVLGAIFVDSGGNLVECERFVEKIGLLGLLRRFLVHGVDVNHPVNTLQQLAKSETVGYCFGREKGTSQNESESQDETGGDVGNVNGNKTGNGEAQNGYHSCSVRIKDIEIASVHGCLSKEEAEVSAASAAVRVLRERGSDVGVGVGVEEADPDDNSSHDDVVQTASSDSVKSTDSGMESDD